jgi:integrase
VALSAIRPTKHPKSGVYRLRLTLPPALRETASRLFGVRTEIIENLKTKDPKEACRLASAAHGRLYAKLDTIRRAAEGKAHVPSDREVALIGGEAYRWRVETQGDDAGTVQNWALLLADIHDRLDEPDEMTGVREVCPTQRDNEEAAGVLRARGWADDPATVGRSAQAITLARYRFITSMLRRANGDWSTDKTSSLYPDEPSKASLGHVTALQSAPPSLDFNELLRGWAADRGKNIDAKPIDRAVYDRLRTAERVATFLGHRDACRVSRADVVRLKEDMQARGRKAATIRNDLSEMKAVWDWGIASGKVPEPNPFGIPLPAKPKKADTKRVRSFTLEEQRTILSAARQRSGIVRWAPWFCMFTGARIGELAQAGRDDIVQEDGIWALRLHAEGEDRSMKNTQSERIVPLHSALIAEGFLEYVQSIPSGCPLWPEVALSMFGRRHEEGARRVRRWLREVVGITDLAVSPNHSWRHTFSTVARQAGIPPHIVNAITGHASETAISAGYGDTVQSMPAVLAPYLERIRSPLGNA